VKKLKVREVKVPCLSPAKETCGGRKAEMEVVT
jgi:hypothetical protein